MNYFTPFRIRIFIGVLVIGLSFSAPSKLEGQATPSPTPSNSPTGMESITNAPPEASNLMANPGATAAAASNQSLVSEPAPPVVSIPSLPKGAPSAAMAPVTHGTLNLLILSSVIGLLLYYVGLGRAKNSAHTSTLLLLGSIFALMGYWMGGFAVQAGGMGDAHAVLTGSKSLEFTGLDHEIGFMALGHYWGVMGNAAFFLVSDTPARSSLATMFLGQAILAIFTVTIALSGGLERGRLLSMAVAAFLMGALIYPLLANWIWGGGWLAALGREFSLGHGMVDLAGAGVIHLTAGTLAWVLALTLGPRQGRFGRNHRAVPFPGHHVPSIIQGALILLVALAAVNATFSGDPTNAGPGLNAALAAANTLMAATGGVIASFLLAAYQKRRPEPALLCRGLLGGAVAASGCGALVDSWAALVIGLVAGLIVQGTFGFLERRRLDDPAGAAAVHGAGGAWGLLAVGLFANDMGSTGLNGVEGPLQGLLFGGSAFQLLAQMIGVVTDFGVVFVLGYISLKLIQKIVGLRVDVADEVNGLDWPQVGALGYQADSEMDELGRS